MSPIDQKRSHEQRGGNSKKLFHNFSIQDFHVRKKSQHWPSAIANSQFNRSFQKISRSFLASIFSTSTPGTFFKSSIDLKGPFCSRYRMIAAACERLSDNPLSNSIAAALFTLIFGTSSAGNVVAR